MTDLTLLALPSAEFNNLVAEAFKCYRDGDLLGLAKLPLADSSLVEPCFLKGEILSPNQRGRALQLVLRWVVDSLAPSGQTSWTASPWRHYNILYHFYLQEMRIAELAEHMAIAEQTWYQLRLRAIEAAAGLLRAELATPQHGAELKRYAITDKYNSLNALEQQVLRLAAIFRQPIASSTFHYIATQAKFPPLQPLLQRLFIGHLLISNEGGSELLAAPEMRAYLLTLLSPDERQRWHQLAADHYQQQRDYLEAAWHFRQAQLYVQAAQVLIQHHRDIIDQFATEALRHMLSEFRQAELRDKNLWAQLKLVDGQVAMYLEDIDSALDRYGEALGATDTRTKALAYCSRAAAFKDKNLDEAIAHYHYGINLWQQISPPDPQFIQALIEMAWIFIQDRQDFARAETLLRQARDAVQPDNRAAWADLHKAWSDLAYYRQDLTGAIEHQLQAWLAANELQDVERRSRIAYNLGQLYIEAKQYQQGQHYLTQSQALAIQAGNRLVAAAANKGLGGAYFWLADYPQAIRHYELAYQSFEQMGHVVWQAHVCYDLAEVYALTQQATLGQHYYRLGLQLATTLGHEKLQQDLAELAQPYPMLAMPPRALTERQQQVLDYVRQHGQITNRDYRELTGLSQKQAVRDLSDLVEKGLLREDGQGRARRYVGNGE